MKYPSLFYVMILRIFLFFFFSVFLAFPL